MCGITGFVGQQSALPFLLQGLEKLEYRGYDSAGVTLVDDALTTYKVQGKLSALKEAIPQDDCHQKTGIGHTRWATHGVPSQLNAHPHTNKDETISIVHNGIIENYQALKEELIEKGYEFQSQTDSEVIVHLLDDYYQASKDLKEALIQTVARLEGSYALCIVSTKEKNQVLVAKKESPMVLGKSEEGSFCGSDATALIAYTKNILVMEDRQIARLTKDDITLFDFEGHELEQTWQTIPYDVEAAQKGGYDSFMLKEIHEQPQAIKETLRGRFTKNHQIQMPEFDELNIHWDQLKRIYFIACGTAYHACIYAKTILQKQISIPCMAEPASEFRYEDPLIDEDTLCIFVSQSGETADTIAAVKLAKEKGCPTIAITNVLGSSISRLTDVTLYTCAGPEISVASTKAYTTQLVLLTCLDLKMMEHLGVSVDASWVEELKRIPTLSKEVLKEADQIEALAELLKNQYNAYFIGRQLDYPTALEGALKLKEISYIHADAYYAGELKHGPIALIEKDDVVIAVATQKEVAMKTFSNMEETIARGAKVIVITANDIEVSGFTSVIHLPKVKKELTPIISIILLQLLAYHAAKLKGCNIDQPRNLAKSVTVE